MNPTDYKREHIAGGCLSTNIAHPS